MALLSEDRAKKADTAPEPTKLTAGQVRDLYNKGVRDTRSEAYDYWLNYAFLENHQWLFFNTETNRLDEVPRDPDRVQATVNRLLPSSRTVIAKATSRTMAFEVPPTAADDATIRGSKISESIVRDTHRKHDWESLREDLIWDTWRGGYAAVSVDWDPSLGDVLEISDTGKTVGTGDTVETVLSAVEFVVEPGARIAEKARWWIKARALPPEQVQAEYHLTKLPKADATAGMSPLQAKLLAQRGNRQDGGDGATADLTLVLTYYERPNWLAPKGRIVTVVGEQIVDGPHDWYFPFKDHLNFALQRETHKSGRWTGSTVLSAARPVQVLFNQAWSSIVEDLKHTGNPRLAIHATDVDLNGTLTDQAGEEILYTEKPPQWLNPPQLPNWITQSPDNLASEIDDILGVHEISRGEAPPNIESGFGLSVLAEQDQTPLGRLVKESATVWGKVASMVLKLYEAKVGSVESRKAIVHIPGQPPETTDWTGDELIGQTTAVVPVDTIMPRSRAAMQAFAEKALQMGLITNVAQFARVAEYPGQADLIQAVAPDIAKARWENHMLAQGEPVEPDDFDDHAMHGKEHDDFRKTARYRLLSPEAREVVDLHCKAHKTLLSEQAGVQVAASMVDPRLAAAQGGPVPADAMGAAAAEGEPPLPGAQDAGGPGSLPGAPTPPPEADGPSRVVPPTE